MVAAGHEARCTLVRHRTCCRKELCPLLGIAIPVGKDSMSMRAKWIDSGTEEQVTSPLSLIVTGFAPVTNARKTLTPELHPRG